MRQEEVGEKDKTSEHLFLIDVTSPIHVHEFIQPKVDTEYFPTSQEKLRVGPNALYVFTDKTLRPASQNTILEIVSNTGNKGRGAVESLVFRESASKIHIL